MVHSSECFSGRSRLTIWLNGAARHSTEGMTFDTSTLTSIGSVSCVIVRCRVWWSMTVTLFSLATTSMAG